MIRLPLIVLLSSLTVLSSAPVRGACTDGPEVMALRSGANAGTIKPRVTALQARLSIIVPA